MSRNRVIIAAAVALVVVVGLGVWLYNQVLGDTEAASGPITAVPLATQPPAATDAPAAAATATPESVATAAPAAEAAAPAATAEAAAPAGSGVAPNTQLRYRIVPEESKVSFTLSEELRGQPVQVVGESNQVAGELAVNPSDLATAQVGVVQVNARTFATDSGQRDRAIRNFILSTDSYEFITFTPKEIQGLSGSGATGQPFTFKIAGDLTIRDVTRPAVFDATVQAESAERLTGSATAVVNRSDFNLTIPNVPFVANVGEQVTLAIDFVAAPVAE